MDYQINKNGDIILGVKSRHRLFLAFAWDATIGSAISRISIASISQHYSEIIDFLEGKKSETKGLVPKEDMVALRDQLSRLHVRFQMHQKNIIKLGKEGKLEPIDEADKCPYLMHGIEAIRDALTDAIGND